MPEFKDYGELDVYSIFIATVLGFVLIAALLVHFLVGGEKGLPAHQFLPVMFLIASGFIYLLKKTNFHPLMLANQNQKDSIDNWVKTYPMLGSVYQLSAIRVIHYWKIKRWVGKYG